MEETQNEVKECPFCAQKINIRAKKCPFCREAIDPVLIMLEKQQNTQGREINITLDSGRPTVHIPKNRTSYILLAACRSEIFGFGKSMSIPIDA